MGRLLKEGEKCVQSVKKDGESAGRELQDGEVLEASVRSLVGWSYN